VPSLDDSCARAASASASLPMPASGSGPSSSELHLPRTAPRVIGTKSAAVCRWIFDLLGAAPGDTLDDLFPGSGAVGRAWAVYTRQGEPSPLW